MIRAPGEASMVAAPVAGATTARASRSNKVLIKKVVGLIVVTVVCVAVVVIILNVLKTFGGSSDGAKEEDKFDGKPRK